MKHFILACMFLLCFSFATASRPVIVEDFTGLWCPTSYASELALDQIRSEYSRDQVIVVSYHLQDLLSVPINSTRADYYTVANYPTLWFNGVIRRVGGNAQSVGDHGIEMCHAIYKAAIDSELARTDGIEPFECNVEGNIGPTNPIFRATIKSLGYPNQVAVILLITEDSVPVSTSIGLSEESSVVRAYLATVKTTLETSQTLTINADIVGTIPYVDAANLKPVVFIQDTVTKEIVGGTGTFSGIIEPPPTSTPTPTLIPSLTPTPEPTKVHGKGNTGGGKGHNK